MHVISASRRRRLPVTGLAAAVVAVLLVLFAPLRAHAADDTLTASPTTVAAGDTFTVSFSVTTYTGTNQQLELRTFDSGSLGTLPAFTSVVSCTGNAAPCSESGNATVIPLGSFTTRTPVSGSITLRVDPGTPAGTFGVGSAISGDSGAATSARTSTITVTAPAADLSTSTALTGSLLGAGTVGVTATVTNAGPGTATGISTTTTLPAQTTSVSALPAACSYDPAARTVTCTTATLAAAASTSFSYTAHESLLTLGTLPAATTATATTTDPDPADNTSSASCTAVTSLVIIC
ncbi:hypothetical protein ACFV6F_26795 [Kitasatospora phosalacinea]|uniref:hypothetical protein n=1 Tax=Kitasatospora phosalacinea TaxID=2065 RepID=UPI00365FF638